MTGSHLPELTDFYNGRFRRWDLKFGLPTSDSCCTCDEFKIKIEAVDDQDEAHRLRNEHREHLLEVRDERAAYKRGSGALESHSNVGRSGVRDAEV